MKVYAIYYNEPYEGRWPMAICSTLEGAKARIAAGDQYGSTETSYDILEYTLDGPNEEVVCYLWDWQDSKWH